MFHVIARLACTAPYGPGYDNLGYAIGLLGTVPSFVNVKMNHIVVEFFGVKRSLYHT